jgi:acetyltransferase
MRKKGASAVETPKSGEIENLHAVGGVGGYDPADTPADTDATVSDCHSLQPDLQVATSKQFALCVAEETLGKDAQGVVVHLADGAAVRVRPARCDDEQRLRAMFLGLSTQTRYLYFCAGVPANEIWAERFATLARVDGETSFALVAETVDAAGGRGTVIGLARFVRGARASSADIGILLADRWQARGLGRIVLGRLRTEALRRAVSVFTGTMLWENRRMLRLAKRVFPQVNLNCAQGVCDLTIALS